MIKRIINNVPGKTVLLFFIISSTLYFIMLLGTIPHLHNLTGGLKIPDMMPTGYDSDYIVRLMEALGKTGRNYYLFRQLPIDLVFPFFFAISNCMIMGWFLKKLNKLDTNWYLVCYLPIIAGIFDYAENFSIISLINNYPEINKTTVLVSNLFSVLKSSVTTIALTVLIVILLVFLFRRIFNRN